MLVTPLNFHTDFISLLASTHAVITLPLFGSLTSASQRMCLAGKAL